jgi:hypothetical protein
MGVPARATARFCAFLDTAVIMSLFLLDILRDALKGQGEHRRRGTRGHSGGSGWRVLSKTAGAAALCRSLIQSGPAQTGKNG